MGNYFNILKITGLFLAYFILFSAFEYINSVNMVKESYTSIITYAIKPYIFIFFAMSAPLVWMISKAIYDITDKRFYYTGLILAFLEFLSYFLAAILFYKHLPSFRESIAFGLMLIAILISYESK